MTVEVDNKVIARLIGRDGTNINELQKKLGIHIDVEPKVPTVGKEISYNVDETGNSFVFRFNKKMKGKTVNVYIDSDYLFSATVGKKNEIKVNKPSGIGKEILRAIVGKKKIRVLSV